MIKKTSEILFTIMAFKAALFANTRVNQKLVNGYEHTPTPSQPIKSCRKCQKILVIT